MKLLNSLNPIKIITLGLLLMATHLQTTSHAQAEGGSNTGGGGQIKANGHWMLSDNLGALGIIGVPYAPTGGIKNKLENIIDKVSSLSPTQYRTNTFNAMRSLFYDQASYLIVENLDCDRLKFFSITGMDLNKFEYSESARSDLRSKNEDGLSQAESFACTIDGVTYLDKTKFKRLQSEEEKALALMHERLHTLESFVSERKLNHVMVGISTAPGGGYSLGRSATYIDTNDSYHVWIKPYIRGSKQVENSGLNPNSNNDVTTLKLMQDVNSRICLSVFSSGCSETDNYDPVGTRNLEMQRKEISAQQASLNALFKKGFNARKLTLKTDIDFSTGDTVKLGYCQIQRQKDFNDNRIINSGTTFNIEKNQGAIYPSGRGDGSPSMNYTAFISITSNSSSSIEPTSMSIYCEGINSESIVYDMVREIRSQFQLDL